MILVYLCKGLKCMINKFLSQDEAYAFHRNSQASKLLTKRIIESKKAITKLATEFEINQTQLSVMQNGYKFYSVEFDELCKPNKFNISDNEKSLVINRNTDVENYGAYIFAINEAYNQIAKYMNIGIYYNCIYKRKNEYNNYISSLYMLLINNLVYIPTWTSRQKRPQQYVEAESAINEKITNFINDLFNLDNTNNLTQFHDILFGQLQDFELNPNNNEILLKTPEKGSIINTSSIEGKYDAAEKFSKFLKQIPEDLPTIAKWLDISVGHLEKLYYKVRIPSKETKTEIIKHPKFMQMFPLTDDEITQFIGGNEQLTLNTIIKNVNLEMSSNLPKYRIQGIDTLISNDANAFNNKFLYEANGKSIDIAYILLLAKMFNYSCYNKMMNDKGYAIKVLEKVNEFNTKLIKEYRSSINYSFKEIVKPKNNLYSFDNSLLVDKKILNKLNK